MGLFSKKFNCAICDETVKNKQYAIKDKQYLCEGCFKDCNFDAHKGIASLSVSGIEIAIEEADKDREEFDNFNQTKEVIGVLELDDVQKKWFIYEGFLGVNRIPKIYKYKDIIDFELLEDGETITKGGLGSAVVGGMLLGGVGAVVGGITGKKKNKAMCNSLRIKITINNINAPMVYINFISTGTPKSSKAYKEAYNIANECISLFQLMVKIDQSQSTTINDADEILKYKNLLDRGAITEEEFIAKKKKLLQLY